MLPPALQSQIDDLSCLERTDRIDYLIAIGEEYQNFSEAEVPREEVRKVPGCESEVFLASEAYENGRRFRFAVDNPQGISAMAMAMILDRGLSGVAPNLIQEVPEEIVYDIFGRELSMGKSLGLKGMIQMLKREAMAGNP